MRNKGSNQETISKQQFFTPKGEGALKCFSGSHACSHLASSLFAVGAPAEVEVRPTGKVWGSGVGRPQLRWARSWGHWRTLASSAGRVVVMGLSRLHGLMAPNDPSETKLPKEGI